jgi:Skp family chaperone for outer membrane proteins
MATTEDWGTVIGAVAATIYHLSGGAERWGPGRGTTGCSLCGETSSPLLRVSRGQVCLACVAVSNVGLVKDWRRLKAENEEFRALMAEFAKHGPTVKDVFESLDSLVSNLRDRTAENITLKQEANTTAEELATARQTCASLTSQVETLQLDVESLRLEAEVLRGNRDPRTELEVNLSALELTVAKQTCASLHSLVDTLQREVETLRLEAESLRRERDTRAEMAASAAADLLAAPWMVEFKDMLHPRVFQHVLDLVASSTSSAMSKAIEEFLGAILRAVAQGTKMLEGSSQEVIETLEKAGLLRPGNHTGRVLSWLVRRSPLVSRRVGEPVIYAVRMDWFARPPQECLEHHQLRRR